MAGQHKGGANRTTAMNAQQMTLIYSSPNGDGWFLCRDSASGRAFVRHRTNASSGGHQIDSAIDDFLNRAPQNPEHRALLRLIADGAIAEPKATRLAGIGKMSGG